MLGRQARIEHAAPPKIVLTRIQSIRAVHRHALGTRKEPHVSSGRCTGLCRSTPDGTFACPDGGISSHLKNAFAGEKSKFFFALYAAVHDEVNAVGPRIPKKLFKRAAETTLQGILAYEERPLVSIDFLNDPHSAIIDALSTMVIDGTQVKILAWYDNEWGYVKRMIELAQKVAALLPDRPTES